MSHPLSRTTLIQQIRRLEQYEEWKKAVFIRDRFTCQHCGRRNGRKRVIEADHIKPISELVKEFNLATVEMALTCPSLWDITNGRTLCHTCHEQTESYPKQLIGTKRKKKNERQYTKRT